MGRFPRRLSRRVVYRNPWLDLYVDRVRFPAGRLVDHHVVHFSRTSVATVLEDRSGRIALVRSFRYVIGELEWELPGGVMDRGETPARAARRETREESGYESSGHRVIYKFHPVNGLSNKVFYIVRAKAGRKVGEPDPNEIAGVRWFTKAQLKRMIRRNRLRDGFTLVGLLVAFLGGVRAAR